ncbi:ABC transporter permease [Candidatus Woesearchaeota archaeon]|nr:ABC transporter permease [Candidatus Woesearchaeota archaeon]MBW2993847.1 ABC transporter permease [Candidatus Woesearchaeota archaeon]
MIKDYFTFSFKSLKSRRMRTFLTMLGIFIGIAAVVSLVSLGQGLEKAITDQFQAMGTNKILVYPAGGMFGIGSTVVIDKSDLNVIKNARGIKDAGGIMQKVGKIKFGSENEYTWVAGIPTDDSKKIIVDTSNFKIAKGRDIKRGDKYKAVAGIRFSQADVFDKAVNVGDKIEIEGYKFEIVGQMESIGNPDDDSSLLIPLDTANEMFDANNQYSVIMAEVVEGEDISAIAASVKRTLRRHRDVDEGEEDFNLQTFEELMESFSSIFAIVQGVLIGIASISLIVGGVGIMNTMYTAVLQRTNEIGVMKAIGARNSDILLLFLIESGFLGLVGGTVGILIGMAMSKLVELAAAQAGLGILKAYFPWYLIVGALAFSFIIGSIAGVLPARQASKLKPVDALRYE